MDLISSAYNSEDENLDKTSSGQLETIALTPPIVTYSNQKPSTYISVAETSISSNLPYEQMYAPLKGPIPPKKFQKNPGNALNGNVEDYNIDNFTFDENFHTFKNYGYAFDPNQTEKNRVIGDQKSYESFGGATVFRNDILKRRKYRRPEREKKGDPSEVDSYKGPWAKFKEDEDEIEEMQLRQKRMKQLYEAQKSDKSNANDKDEISNDKEEISNGEENSQGETSTNKVDDQKPEEPSETKIPEDKPEESEKQIGPGKIGEEDYGKEETVFEYTHEKDYMGRTYMYCPKEFRNKDPQHKCFIPTKRVHTWRGHTKAVSAIRWFPGTGHVLLSCSMDRSIKLWEANTHRRCLRTITGHEKGVRDITFSKDGSRFLSVGLDQWIKLWDTETGKAISRFNSGVQSQCARFYHPNENEFLAAQSDKLVVGWDARQREIIQKYVQHQKAVNAVVFIDQCRRFASSGDDKKIYIWEYGLPVVVNHISEPYMHTVPCLAETSDGQFFLAQSMDNAVLAYSSDDKIRHRKRRYVGHSVHGYACQVDTSPDNQFLVSGDSEGKAVFWDWKTKRIYKRLRAHSQVTIGATWHPVHPSKVATCSWDATIKLWD